MDALPIEEKSGEPFASTNGCMHACGHDMHASMVLGAARILKAHESELKGTVKLFFQPGEEIFAGAESAIKEGILENPHVDAAFACHVYGMAPTGVVLYGDKPLSSVYGFHITVTGKGVHGSAPEAGVDPINAAVHIFLALQEMIAREISGKEDIALTVGQFHAGTVANIIPETAEMEGTLRTFNKETAEYLIGRITDAAEKIADAYRASAKVETFYNVPPVDNNHELTQEFIASIAKLDENIILKEEFHSMGSEDFAFISRKVPSSYMSLGAGVEDEARWRQQHSPEIVFDEKTLPVGAASFAQIAIDYLENHSK